MPICLRLERQLVRRALSLALAKTGKRMEARMAIIAIVTKSSIKVNADADAFLEVLKVRLILTPKRIVGESNTEDIKVLLY